MSKFVKNPGGVVHSVSDEHAANLPSTFVMATEEEIADWHLRQGLDPKTGKRLHAKKEDSEEPGPEPSRNPFQALKAASDDDLRAFAKEQGVDVKPDAKRADILSLLLK